MERSINICKEVADISTTFEQCNTDLKRRYLIANIILYNDIVGKVANTCGTFGTGYPFYILDKDLNGKLPIIDEQIRYNEALISSMEQCKYAFWNCASCLERNSQFMPDLKQMCIPCPNMSDDLKPRKLINRLPDIDMWAICEKDSIDEIKIKLEKLFAKYNMHTSDVNPIKTFDDLSEIVDEIKKGKMPKKVLPLDAHIIDYQTLSSLISRIPDELAISKQKEQIPYLPIHPLSYRKTWQYDDTAYNFVHDYLSSMTEFDVDENLRQLLEETRKYIANKYSFEELYKYLILSGPESVQRRHKTLKLKQQFERRINSWK